MITMPHYLNVKYQLYKLIALCSISIGATFKNTIGLILDHPDARGPATKPKHLRTALFHPVHICTSQYNQSPACLQSPTDNDRIVNRAFLQDIQTLPFLRPSSLKNRRLRQASLTPQIAMQCVLINIALAARKDIILDPKFEKELIKALKADSKFSYLMTDWGMSIAKEFLNTPFININFLLLTKIYQNIIMLSKSAPIRFEPHPKIPEALMTAIFRLGLTPIKYKGKRYSVSAHWRFNNIEPYWYASVKQRYNYYLKGVKEEHSLSKEMASYSDSYTTRHPYLNMGSEYFHARQSFMDMFYLKCNIFNLPHDVVSNMDTDIMQQWHSFYKHLLTLEQFAECNAFFEVKQRQKFFRTLEKFRSELLVRGWTLTSTLELVEYLIEYVDEMPPEQATLELAYLAKIPQNELFKEFFSIFSWRKFIWPHE